MTHTEQIEAIEKKIREVCPWLMRLSFGCEIKVSSSVLGIGGCEEVYDDNEILTILNHSYGGKCGEDYDGDFLQVWSEGWGRFFEWGNEDDVPDFEILGHPIQLSDLLYAIGRNRGLMLGTSGTFYRWQEERLSNPHFWGEGVAKYNLSKPFRTNLEENKELTDFVWSLLDNK